MKKQHSSGIKNRLYSAASLMLLMFTLSCWNGFKDAYNERGRDEDAPADITMQNSTIGQSGGAEITLNWTEPRDISLNHVLITWTPGGETGIELPLGKLTYTITGLTAGTEYIITVKLVDNTGNESDGATLTFTQSATERSLKYIYTPKELDDVRNDLSGYYIVMADLDLSGYGAAYSGGEGWVPIGPNFIGTFDGNGFTISNLTINRPGIIGNPQGLFAVIVDATVKNIAIKDCQVTGGYYTGGLAGTIMSNSGGNTIITGCNVISTTGTDKKISGSQFVGGLAGSMDPNSGNTTISNCTINIDVSSTSTYTGGLFGRLSSSGTMNIINCKTAGKVSSEGSYTGGFIGYILNSTAGASTSIDGCKALGNVTVTTSTGNYYTGGFAGIFLSNNSSSGIENCTASGNVTVTGTSSGYIRTGGFIGQTTDTGYTNAKILNCGATGKVSYSNTSTGNSNTGGFVGFCTLNSVISGCTAGGEVTSSSTCPDTNTGGFVGYISGGAGSSTIEGCSASGKVSGPYNTGGFAGTCMEGTTVQNSYATGEVIGTSDGTSNYTGGFVGQDYADGGNIYITYCYAKGNVTVSSSVTMGSIGGFSGYTYNSNDTSYLQIYNCYSRGDVTGTSISTGGFSGLVVYNGTALTIDDCYSAGYVSGTGTLYGFSNTYAGITHCFYDSKVGSVSAGAGTEKSTTDMTTNYATTFSAWNFSTIWTIDTSGSNPSLRINNGYPYLQGVTP